MVVSSTDDPVIGKADGEEVQGNAITSLSSMCSLTVYSVCIYS